ncbi:MAG: RNA 2',3'-cyclic phosphodiesterase [Bacteroidia bacterium]|nr:RNA 2',3'-cyclic phosphodiesterase [Bacteroidia bacterium]
MKRTFIAVKIEAGKELSDVIRHCREVLSDEKIKWVEPENLHLTVRFLGDTNPKQESMMKEMLRDISANHLVTTISIWGMGVFRSLDKPSIIRINLSGTDDLRKIYLAIEDRLEEAGFSRESGQFVPHVTIGRIKFLKNRQGFIKLLEKFQDTFFQETDVNELIYYQSILTSSGPIYKPIEKFQLMK